MTLNTCLYLVLTSLAIFLAYNIGIIVKLGLPWSLSESFYRLQKVKKGFGYFFTAMMFSMALTLLPAWLELGEVVSSWSTYMNVLAFITAGALCFVGSAPAYRDNVLESKVHDISAKTCAAAALVWCLATCWQIMYIPIGVAGLVALVAWLTKTFKSSRDYWLEMMCFGATYATVITELIMQIVRQ